MDGNDEAVLLFWKLTDSDFGSREERRRIRQFQEDLMERIRETDVGEFDGDEFGGGFCIMYLYGPSAGVLSDVALEATNMIGLPAGSYLVRRSGGPGSPEQRIEISHQA